MTNALKVKVLAALEIELEDNQTINFTALNHRSHMNDVESYDYVYTASEFDYSEFEEGEYIKFDVTVTTCHIEDDGDINWDDEISEERYTMIASQDSH